MFEAFYSSYWQHPLLLWLLPAMFLLRLARVPRGDSPRFFHRFFVVFTWLTLLDPFMTGPVAQSGLLSSSTNQVVSIFFVILGDLRVFALFWLFGGDSLTRVRAWLIAILSSFLVPVLQFALIGLFPAYFAEVRYTFLAYELLFVVMILPLGVVLARRELPAERRDWLRRILLYVGAYYLLWALADLLILRGEDLGYGLRVLPNLLYYSCFLPFAYFSAPSSLRAPVERQG